MSQPTHESIDTEFLKALGYTDPDNYTVSKIVGISHGQAFMKETWNISGTAEEHLTVCDVISLASEFEIHTSPEKAESILRAGIDETNED